MTIHPTAIVEDGARLGAGVEIGAYCVVGKNAVLGDGVHLHSHVVIQGHVEIGARAVVHSHVVLGGEPQIRGIASPDARLVIGEETILREAVTISVGSARGGGITTVGSRGYFMAGSHIGHDCHVGDDVTFANNVLLAGHVRVGNGVLMGGASAVHQFARIGQYAFVGGVSGVSEDVIPYGLAVGRKPILGGLNLIGLKRRGVPRSTIHEIRAAYRKIFLSDEGRLADRAQRAAETWPNVPQIREIVDFIAAEPTRAIARPGAHLAEEDEG